MGILILPYWLITLLIAITAIVKVFYRIVEKQITGGQAALGLLISMTLFVIIGLNYILERKVYVLDPLFRIPLYTVILPFILALSIQKSYNNFSILLFLSVSVSSVLMVVFNKRVFRILHHLPVSIYH